jgi:uncharacterized coiled-coil protein SlyX
MLEGVKGEYEGFIADLRKRHSTTLENANHLIVGLENRCTILETQNIELKSKIQNYESKIAEKDTTINLQDEIITEKDEELEENRAVIARFTEKDSAQGERIGSLELQRFLYAAGATVLAVGTLAMKLKL